MKQYKNLNILKAYDFKNYKVFNKKKINLKPFGFDYRCPTILFSLFFIL